MGWMNWVGRMAVATVLALEGVPVMSIGSLVCGSEMDEVGND